MSMFTRILIILLVFLLSILIGCSSEQKNPTNQTSSQPSETKPTLTQNTTSFLYDPTNGSESSRDDDVMRYDPSNGPKNKQKDANRITNPVYINPTSTNTTIQNDKMNYYDPTNGTVSDGIYRRGSK